MISRLRFLLLLATTLSTVGCGNSAVTNRPTIRVFGTVKLDGEPVETGSVLFEPKDAKGAAASATITDGKYETQVEPGIKVVRIRYPKVIGEEPVYPGSKDSPVIDKVAEQIPAKYNSNTELERDLTQVKESVDFDLQSK